MKTQEYTARYGHTLHTNPHTKESYIKVPLADLSELGYMNEALLKGLLLISQADEHIENDTEVRNTIYWLCRILLASCPVEELEGITELLK